MFTPDFLSPAQYFSSPMFPASISGYQFRCGNGFAVVPSAAAVVLCGNRRPAVITCLTADSIQMLEHALFWDVAVETATTHGAW
jgi:hypothetical protein